METKIIEHLGTLSEAYKNKLPDAELLEQLRMLSRTLRNDIEAELRTDEKTIYGNVRESKELADEFMARLNRKPDEVAKKFMPTGFQQLDEIDYRISKGELVVIGGRPGMGKTSVMIVLASNFLRAGKRVMYYSFDLSDEQVITRLIAARSGVELYDIEKNKLDEEAHLSLFEASRDIADSPFFVVENPDFDIRNFIRRCKEDIEKIKPQVIFIDYLQLLDESNHRHTRDVKISILMRELKTIAKTLNVTIITGSQLSRAVESRGGTRRPQLSDLRDSGTIEQEADKVIFIYRPEYYDLQEDENGNSTKGLMELIISKNRNGRTGAVMFQHNSSMSQITEFDRFANDLLISKKRMDDFDSNPPF